MRDCVEHFVEGRDSWKVGILGFFLRLRGIVASIAVALLIGITTMTGPPFWWPGSFSQIYEIKPVYFILAFFLSLALVAIAGLNYLRKRFQRSLNVKYHLHEIAHNLRDHHTITCQKITSKRHQNKLSHEDAQSFRSYANDICERLKDYFREITYDNTVEVSIRLAIEKNRSSDYQHIAYHTIGRSSGLSSKRSETTEDISANEGIARFLIEVKECRGILIYNDLGKAAIEKAYKPTSNDDKYRNEIATMMVSPLNAWDVSIKQQSMIGILYITSRNNTTFSVEHTDSMRFVSDMIASNIATIVSILVKANRMPLLGGC